MRMMMKMKMKRTKVARDHLPSLSLLLVAIAWQVWHACYSTVASEADDQRHSALYACACGRQQLLAIMLQQSSMHEHADIIHGVKVLDTKIVSNIQLEGAYWESLGVDWSWAEAGKGLIWEAVARGYYHQRVGVGLDYHQRVGVAMVSLGGRVKVT